MAALKQLPDDAPDFYSALVSAADLRAQGLLREREYPQMWHCRGGESDIEKILEHMSVIPVEFKHSISIEYEKLFAQGGPAARKQANQFLVRQSKRFRGVPHGN
jgi:hypothetical protein